MPQPRPRTDADHPAFRWQHRPVPHPASSFWSCPPASANATNWSNLEKTTSFALDIGGTKQDILPDFSGATSMTAVASRLTAAIMAASGAVMKVNVAWSAADQAFRFTPVATPVPALSLTEQAVPGRVSIFNAPNAARFTAPAPFATDPKQPIILRRPDLSRGLPDMAVVAGTLDPAAWVALGQKAIFSINIDGTTRIVRPDFSAGPAITSMTDVAARLQAAIDNAFVAGRATVVWNADLRRFIIKSTSAAHRGLGQQPVGVIGGELHKARRHRNGRFRQGRREHVPHPGGWGESEHRAGAQPPVQRQRTGPRWGCGRSSSASPMVDPQAPTRP